MTWPCSSLRNSLDTERYLSGVAQPASARAVAAIRVLVSMLLSPCLLSPSYAGIVCRQLRHEYELMPLVVPGRRFLPTSSRSQREGKLVRFMRRLAALGARSEPWPGS